MPFNFFFFFLGGGWISRFLAVDNLPRAHWDETEFRLSSCSLNPTCGILVPPCISTGRGSSIGSEFAWHEAAPSSIPTSGTFFRGDLVMKTFLRPFSLFRWFKKSSCQLLAKECALSTGKLPRRLAQEQCG